MKKSYKKHIIAAVSLFILVIIRFYEKRFFNDDLISFFQHDYLSNDLPEISVLKTILTDSFRYWLNAVFSIAILYIYFKQTGLLKFLLLVYTFAFTVGLILLYLALHNYQAGHYLFLFYIRRFMIQPLLLFLLFPALWHQNNLKLKQ